MKKQMKQSAMSRFLAIFSLAMVGFGIIAMLFSSWLSMRVNTATNNRYELTNQANAYKITSSYLTDKVRSYVATSAITHYNKYWDEMNNQKTRDKAVEKMKKIGLTQDEQKQLAQIQELSASLNEMEKGAMENVQANKSDRAFNTVYGNQYSDGVNNITYMADTFVQNLSKRTQAEVQQITTIQTIVNILLVVFMLLLGFCQIIYAIAVNNRVIRPIIKLSNNMADVAQGNLTTELGLEADTSEIGVLTASVLRTKQTFLNYVEDISNVLLHLAEGDLTVQVTREYVGDFQPIKISMQKIISSLNATLSAIDHSAEQVSGGAEQIANGAQSMSQGASEQASSIEELSATTNRIFAEIESSADSAKAANVRVQEVSHHLQESNTEMQKMMDAISNISSSSQEIGKIIKTIEDIAFQTNILALNAAVEAARAGEAGKGFAVVADEVRNLAGKSAEAARNTTALIEKSVKAVENGTNIASATAKSLLGVVDGATEISKLVADIADTANHQTSAVKQVGQGIEQISGVVQTNSATAEESAAASQQLAAQAKRLKELVVQFRFLNEDGSEPSSDTTTEELEESETELPQEKYAVS